MKRLLLLYFCLVFPFLAFSQAEHPVSNYGDYKQYLQLSYAEMDSLVVIPYEKGDFSQCIVIMKAGQEKARNEFGELDSVFATYTGNLGFFYDHIGQYEQALALYIQAKNIKEKVLGIEHPEFALSLNNLAELHQSMGNYTEALPLLIQANNIFEKVLGIEHPDFAQLLNNLALLYKDMGNYTEALPLLIQAKNIREKVLGIEHPDFAESLNNLALLYQSMGNYAQALPLLIQTKNIFEKMLGVEHPYFATLLHNLAGLHRDMGSYAQALSFFIQAKDIQEKVLGKEHPEFAQTLNNLALVYQDMGNYTEALSFFIQAKNIQEKVLGKEHPEFAQTLNNLAVFYKTMGNYVQALPLLIQAKNIREKVLGKEHPNFARSLNNLAALHQKMENYRKTMELIGQVMDNMSKTNLQLSFSKSWVDSLKAVDYQSNKHIEEILTSLKITYELLEKDTTIINPKLKQINITDLALFLLNQVRNQVSNEKDRLRVLAESNDWMQRSFKMFNTKEHTTKAFNLSDQNKSVLLLQATRSEVAYRLGELPDSLIWEDKKMLKKQSQLEAKLLEKRPESEKDSLRNELNHVNQDMDAFVKMIKKEYPKYHKLKYQQVDAKVEDIQALLDDKTVLVEYVIADTILHIFKVRKNDVVWTPYELNKKVLNEKIKDFHSVLKDYKLLSKKATESYQKYTELAYWFYQNTLEPVLKNEKDAKNLIIVSDCELGHLPFETFLIEPAPQSLTDYNQLHYLVSDYNISYNYSATLWKENKEAPAPKNNGKILAMAANYEIKLDSSMMDVRLPTDQWLRDALQPLPAARKEVETLQEKYQGFFAFDKEASEKTVKAKASEYAILHFATHGILDAKRPVLSSLAFTEDNDSTESNFWQAHEISKMELNADLVVLSACETGYGKFESGNGIASLARAFMYAGSPALIVSLWQVNDHATSEIMKNLYDNLANGMKKDEALRQAKLQYMKTAKGIMAHPAFWSPFIMMGKTDAVYIKTKSNPIAWGVGIGVVALIGIGGLALSKRKNKEVA